MTGRLPGLLGKWIPENHHRIAGFLMDVLVQQRWLAGWWMLANVGASVLEGTSMTLLYLAIGVLMENDPGALSEKLGWLGETIEPHAASLGTQTLFLVLIALVATAQILQSSFYFAGYGVSAVLRMRIRRSMMKTIIGQMMDMSFSEISRYKSGELWTHVTLGKGLEKLFGDLNHGIYTALMALAYATVLMALSWKMTLIALVLLGLLTLSLRTVMRKIHEMATQNLDLMRKLNMNTAEMLAGMRLIRSYSAENKAKEVFGDFVDRSSHVSMLGTIWQGTISPIIDIVTVFILVLAMAGISLVFADRLVDMLPTVLVFIFVLARLMPRLGHLNSLRARLIESWPMVEHTTEFLRRDNKRMIRHGGKPFVGFRNGIEFRNVILNYLTDERPAVSGLSFFVPHGGTLALVGESGAGKSSVVDLLLGLFEPTQGEILVDGVSLKDIDGETWRRKIGVVSQDTFLFASNIRENIAFSEPDATEEAIINAARVAHADEFISELESGYDTQLGDRGFRLSGGQRQRLAMARAILRDPEVLILDEATSNLDSQSEYLIQRALESFGENRTVVIVAHRLSTVRGADKILVMRQGRLVEQGTHDELIVRKGTYAEMWRLQA